MEKKYEITEKQLAFLEDYLDRKYPEVSNDVKIELIDHLVSDFEINGNGNLSQYLSNELGFIKKFTSSRVQLYKKKYSKETWKLFFSFFTNLKLIPTLIFSFLIFYFLSENLSNKWLWLMFSISYFILFFLSIVNVTPDNKKIKKLDEVKQLGAEIWLPYIIISLSQGLDFQNKLMESSLFFSFLWLFCLFYSIAAYLISIKHKKAILKKYKHLLN